MGKWHAGNFIFEDGVRYEDAGGGFVWVKDFLPKEIKKVKYGPLFAYMYRRFGIPQRGSDDHKEIANWYIETPDTAVALRVSPKPSGVLYTFGYAIDTRVYTDRFDEGQVKAVQAAMVTAMMDLLTPVFVRDVPINALGRVDEDEDTYNNVCNAWIWAGYGVPVEYFEKRFS